MTKKVLLLLLLAAAISALPAPDDVVPESSITADPETPNTQEGARIAEVDIQASKQAKVDEELRWPVAGTKRHPEGRTMSLKGNHTMYGTKPARLRKYFTIKGATMIALTDKDQMAAKAGIIASKILAHQSAGSLKAVAATKVMKLSAAAARAAAAATKMGAAPGKYRFWWKKAKKKAWKAHNKAWHKAQELAKSLADKTLAALTRLKALVSRKVHTPTPVVSTKKSVASAAALNKKIRQQLKKQNTTLKRGERLEKAYAAARDKSLHVSENSAKQEAKKAHKKAVKKVLHHHKTKKAAKKAKKAKKAAKKALKRARNTKKKLKKKFKKAFKKLKKLNHKKALKTKKARKTFKKMMKKAKKAQKKFKKAKKAEKKLKKTYKKAHKKAKKSGKAVNLLARKVFKDKKKAMKKASEDPVTKAMTEEEAEMRNIAAYTDSENKKALKVEGKVAKQEHQEAHLRLEKEIEITAQKGKARNWVRQMREAKQERVKNAKKKSTPLTNKQERKKDKSELDKSMSEENRELDDMRHDLRLANRQAVKYEIKVAKKEHKEADTDRLSTKGYDHDWRVTTPEPRSILMSAHDAPFGKPVPEPVIEPQPEPETEPEPEPAPEKLTHKQERKKDKSDLDKAMSEENRELHDMRHDLRLANRQAVKYEIKVAKKEHKEADTDRLSTKGYDHDWRVTTPEPRK